MSERERPVFLLRIEFTGDPAFTFHQLRRLLKSLIRNAHFRVRSIEQIGGPQ